MCVCVCAHDPVSTCLPDRRHTERPGSPSSHAVLSPERETTFRSLSFFLDGTICTVFHSFYRVNSLQPFLPF